MVDDGHLADAHLGPFGPNRTTHAAIILYLSQFQEFYIAPGGNID